MELLNKKVIDPNTPVDKKFDAESENPQSGKAIFGYISEVIGGIENGSY
jgi:hypothetical protein